MRTRLASIEKANFCVLFTANDAFMRDYDLINPEDFCVSNMPRENKAPLVLTRKFSESRYATVRKSGPQGKR